MPTDRSRIAGVYLLTPDATGAAFDRVLAIVDAALTAGVKVVQYRNKVADDRERERQASAIVQLVKSAGGLAIVNDRPGLAAAAGADGVHLGRDDGDVGEARRLLPEALIGVSCYDQLGRAEQAVADGADAIAFGSMFPSSTKPGAVHASLELLRSARRRWPTRRVIAIGGIDSGNIHEVAEAGAHAAALISAVFEAEDPRRAAGELVHRFNEGQQRHESQRAAV
ncbi:MAG: thiamine phosphate synthase [Burkholderiaceae bacterium]